MQVAHEPKTSLESQPELIGAGPNMQRRADDIGSNLADLLEKQSEAMLMTLTLCNMYRAECRQWKLCVKE